MRVFLTAEWRNLLMLNYAVDPKLLQRHLPVGLELDFWNGKTYVSMVGFYFFNTRIFGIKFPWHAHFEEINLRYYVRKKTSEGWRRGVVFIREIVPRRIIAEMAKIFYNEPYLAMPTRHILPTKDGQLCPGTIRYEWFFQKRWNSLSAEISDGSHPLAENSEEEFIAEHYWGYTPQPKRNPTEYAVEHPRWDIFPVRNAALDCDASAIYGAAFADTLRSQPDSAFLAKGSPVVVRSASKTA
ncbi:MAG: DUF2071 domain-containing protein [Verrucomicrobiota bacterium]